MEIESDTEKFTTIRSLKLHTTDNEERLQKVETLFVELKEWISNTDALPEILGDYPRSKKVIEVFQQCKAYRDYEEGEHGWFDKTLKVLLSRLLLLLNGQLTIKFRMEKITPPAPEFPINTGKKHGFPIFDIAKVSCTDIPPSCVLLLVFLSGPLDWVQFERYWGIPAFADWKDKGSPSNKKMSLMYSLILYVIKRRIYAAHGADTSDYNFFGHVASFCTIVMEISKSMFKEFNYREEGGWHHTEAFSREWVDPAHNIIFSSLVYRNFEFFGWRENQEFPLIKTKTWEWNVVHVRDAPAIQRDDPDKIISELIIYNTAPVRFLPYVNLVETSRLLKKDQSYVPKTIRDFSKNILEYVSNTWEHVLEHYFQASKEMLARQKRFDITKDQWTLEHERNKGGGGGGAGGVEPSNQQKVLKQQSLDNRGKRGEFFFDIIADAINSILEDPSSNPKEIQMKWLILGNTDVVLVSLDLDQGLEVNTNASLPSNGKVDSMSEKNYYIRSNLSKSGVVDDDDDKVYEKRACGKLSNYRFGDSTPYCADCRSRISQNEQLVCGRCLNVYYCNVECQTRDWKKCHHNVCKR